MNNESKTTRDLMHELKLNIDQQQVLFDLIQSEPNDNEKLELQFLAFCREQIRLIGLICSSTGYTKTISGIPPEQNGLPDYDTEQNEVDASGLSNLVKNHLSHYENNMIGSDPFDHYDDVTMEEWLENSKYNINRINMDRYINSYKPNNKSMDITQTRFESPELNFSPNIFIDDDIVKAAKGFIVGPIGLFRNKPVAAQTRKYASLEDLKKDILIESSTSDMVLYRTCTTEQKQYGDADPFSFTPEEWENLPKDIVYIWRGAFVDTV